MLQWWNPDHLMRQDVVAVEEKSEEESVKHWPRYHKEPAEEGPHRNWMFKVKAEVNPGEKLCVTGNSKALGQWASSTVFRLTKDTQEDNLWTGIAEIAANYDVEYRYVVCQMFDNETEANKDFLMVRNWETFSQPRVAKKSDEAGRCEQYGFHNGQENTSRGWLSCSNTIQLKLFNNPIRFWKNKLLDRKIYVKVTAIELTKSQNNNCGDQLVHTEDGFSMETSDQPSPVKNWPVIEIAVLNEEERTFQLQEQFGHECGEDDFIIFQASVLVPETIAYLMDFYTYASRKTSEDEPPYHIGFSYILPSAMKASEGQLVVPITSVRHQPIGEITVEYLVIKPIKDFDCSMKNTMQQHWKDSWRGLDVGHRGSGSSFNQEPQKCADVRENTIASLKNAAKYGADFVEFDVQLSRDLVPVLYHDFYVCISMKRKKDIDDSDMLQLPVKDLTLEQLHLLKLYHLEEGRRKKRKDFVEDSEDHQPFPTLRLALETLDPSVGFNVEIKWTMKLKDGTYELYHPFDVNLFLDVVLRVVLTYADTRPIVFSCFHPDICTMIQFKQNRYPVMLLTQCITPKYPAYYDPRCQSVPMAINFAVASEILGINVHTEELLRDPSQIKTVEAAGLVLFCWGEDNNNVDTIRLLKEMGLHGVIYDKINQFSDKEVKESIFRLEARESEKVLIKAVAEKAASLLSPEHSLAEESSIFSDISKDKAKFYFDITKALATTEKETGSCTSNVSLWLPDTMNTDPIHGEQKLREPTLRNSTANSAVRNSAADAVTRSSASDPVIRNSASDAVMRNGASDSVIRNSAPVTMQTNSEEDGEQGNFTTAATEV